MLRATPPERGRDPHHHVFASHAEGVLVTRGARSEDENADGDRVTHAHEQSFGLQDIHQGTRLARRVPGVSLDAFGIIAPPPATSDQGFALQDGACHLAVSTAARMIGVRA